MIDTLASAVVFLAGLYLVGLAVASFVAPALATRFLLGFAGSAFAHYLELSLRLVVGGAFLLNAHNMVLPGAFAVLGWVLVITTAGLLAVPWQWHRSFAQRSVPHAVRYIRLLGVASLAFGAFVLLATIRGAALYL